MTMATKLGRLRAHAESRPVTINKESEFSFALIRVAVSQICQSMGFKGSQQPALEALTDVAARHLEAIAGLAVASANSGGRTESNLTDIIVALEGLASVRGFQGLSNVRSPPLYDSAVVKDLIKFVKYADEIPFAQPLPRRSSNRCSKEEKVVRCCDYGGGERRHLPRWLPAMPAVGEVAVSSENREKEVKWGCFIDEKGMKKVAELEDGSNGTTELSSLSLEDGSNGTTELSSLSLKGKRKVAVSSSLASCKRLKVSFKIGRGVVD